MTSPTVSAAAEASGEEPGAPIPQRWSADRAMRLVLAGAALFHLAWFLASRTPIPPGNDANRYLVSAFTPDGLFSDLFAPSGYPLFMHVVGVLPARAESIALAQHLLALLTAWMVWLIGRRIAERLDVSAWWAVPGAAFVGLNGDLGFYAHAIMTENLSIALIVLTALLAERLTAHGDSTRRMILLAAAIGALLAANQTVRTVAGPTLAVLVGLSLIWVAGWRQRLSAAATVIATASLVMGGYLLAVDQSKHQQTGLGGMDGWYLYARTASFQDCSRFQPRSDLRDLCITTPPADRPGVFAYVYSYPEFEQQTPAVAKYGSHPLGNDDLREFARQTILSQPLAYVETVGRDLLRYVAPTAGTLKPYSGPGPEFQELTTLPAKTVGDEALEALGSEYDPGPLAAPMEAWMQISRLPPLVLIAFVLLPLLGLLRLRGTGWAGTVVPMWVAALVSATLPVMVGSYEHRFMLPALVLLSITGPMTIAALLSSSQAARRARGDDGHAA